VSRLRQVLLTGFLALAVIGPALGREAAVSPVVVFENDRVRILHPRVEPGQRSPMHEHPMRVIVALADATVEQSIDGGATSTIELKAGDVRVAPPVRHAVGNVGAAPLDLVEVEIKPVADGRPSGLADASLGDPAHFARVYEDAALRVLRFRLGPHEKAPMHSHGDHVSVNLTDQHGRVTTAAGETREVTPTAGTAAWAPPQTHSSENLSESPFEVVEIELLTAPR